MILIREVKVWKGRTNGWARNTILIFSFLFWLITTYIEKEENDHNKGTQP